MSTVDRLVEEAGKLPDDEKLALANRVLELSEHDGGPEVERSWDTEIRRRIEAYDKGESSVRSAGDVFERVDSRLPS